MKTIGFSNITVGGELFDRAAHNFDRLEQPEYMPENVFKDGYEWPGDIEGRTILALVLLAQATKREPAHLKVILDEIPAHLNRKGYFGRILPAGRFDEQQLSGNSWVLRGLCEYARWKTYENVLGMIRNIVQNLLLPLKGYYAGYSIGLKDRIFVGGAIGNLAESASGNWYSSSDIGCAFILLDGATQAYEILRDEELASLIDEMIDKFLSIDFLMLSCQTHATLTALRGILRYYEIKQDTKLLDAVISIFSLYTREAMTENYGNYNWFGRPEWTEPCAIVDSFIIAVTLWKLTRDADYIGLAHNIYYNALGYAQRPNGGFGCDVCVGPAGDYLTPVRELFEAYWCCTMRGGEGLARVVEYTYFLDDNTLFVPFYFESTVNTHFSDGYVTFKLSTGYPFNGTVRIEILSSTIKAGKSLHLYKPEWVEDDDVKVSINAQSVDFQINKGFIMIALPCQKGDCIELFFPIDIRKIGLVNSCQTGDAFRLAHGALLLGVNNNDGKHIELGDGAQYDELGEGKYKNNNTDCMLSPINNLIKLNMEEAKYDKRTIIFRVGL